MPMFEYIVKKLVDKYKVSREEAVAFYYDIAIRYKLESLIVKIEQFDCYEALKTYYLGGTQNELQQSLSTISLY